MDFFQHDTKYLKRKGGENVQKQIIKIAVAFLFVLTVLGASSAVNTVDTSSTQYQVGSDVTTDAMANTGPGGLNLGSSTSNLLITNAGSALLNGENTQDSVQAVVDKTSTLTGSQKITHGSGNLLTINDPNGQLEFTFVSNGASGLMAKKYTVSATGVFTPGATVYIGTAQSEAQFQAAIATLGSNGFTIANIANLWAAGAPADLMASTFTTGNINQGTMDNYAMTRAFALTYPTGSNYVITHAGGMDDDALIYGPFGFNDILFSTSSGTDDETVFINYNTISNQRSGILALMSRNDLTNAYGSAVVTGTLSEINFNLYLLNILKNNPYALFTVEELRTVNEANIQHLWYDPAVGYGYGIDKAYIATLSNAASPTWATNIIPTNSYAAMFALGQTAYDRAISSGVFADADVLAGNVAVVLAPYYVNILGGTQSLAGLVDGIASRNTGFNINNILTIRNPWTWTSETLRILFVRADPASSTAYAASHLITDLTINSVKVSYNHTSNAWSPTQTRDISPREIAGTAPFNKGGYLIPAVAGIQYAWAANAPHSFIRTISRVGCICSAREYDAAMNSQGMFTLGPNEHYILMALTQFGANGLPTETNRQISGRTTAYGVSPSQATYYQAQNNNEAYDSILIRWNDITQTGTAALIRFDSSGFNAAMIATGYTSAIYAQEAVMFWHADRVWNGGPDAALVASFFTIERSIPINAAILSTLTAAGGDPVKFMLNYVVPVTPVTPSQGTSGNIFDNIGGMVSSAFNGLGTSNTATNEIAPGLPLGQSTPATATTTSSLTTGLPIGAILGVILLIIAAILVYLGRNTIVETLTGHGRPGK